MSWLFSLALVEEYLAGICSAGEPSAPSSSTPTQRAFLSHGKTTVFSRLSRFGMTCEPLTEARGEELLTSYLADFRARTSAPPEGEPGSTANEADSGVKWRASSVMFCLDSSSWKTAHCLWEEDLPSSSVILPRWGMTRSGAVFQHPTAERPISATASGLWRTPSAREPGISAERLIPIDGGQPGGMNRHFDKVTGRMAQIGLAQQIKLREKFWPTPLATDGSKGGPNQRGGSGDLRLASAVHRWPTPKANDAEKRGNFDMNNPRNGLPAAVRKFPTPTASASKGWAPNHNRASTDDRLDYTVERESFRSGQQTPPMRLNPEWVEWLMGWPLGWTDLKPLAMDRFREWRQQHSLCSPEFPEKEK